MSEICLKFSISTLTLRNRSGFQMGWWLALATPALEILLPWWVIGWLGPQPQDGDRERVWRCFPWASGAGFCIVTLPGMAAPRSCLLPSCKHLWAPRQQLTPVRADLKHGVCLLSFNDPSPASVRHMLSTFSGLPRGHLLCLHLPLCAVQLLRRILLI